MGQVVRWEQGQTGAGEADGMASGGRIKRGEGVLIGDAGEYAVMSELLKQQG